MNFPKKRNRAIVSLILLVLISSLFASSRIYSARAADNFTIKVSPPILDISPGVPGYFSMRLTSLAGFDGPVYFALTLPGNIPKDFAYSFQPTNYVTLTPNGFGYGYLKVEIPSTVTTEGEYTLVIKASAKGQDLTVQAVVRVNFPAKNFGLSVSPPSQTVPAGSSTSYNVFMQEMGKITDQVTLVTYDFPDGIIVNFNPVSLNPPGTSIMIVQTSSNLPGGTYYLAIGGEYGSLRHTAIVALTVTTTVKMDFDMAVEPTIQYIPPGASAAYTILVTSKGGFNSPVNLTVKGVPSGIQSSLSISPVIPPPNGVGYSILLITTPTYGSPTGTFTIVVAGASGSLTDSSSAMLVITTASEFAITVSPSSQVVTKGQSAKYDVTVSSIGQFSADVALGLNGFPPGVTYEFKPSSVKPATGKSATATLTVTTSDKTDDGTYTLIVSGQSGGMTHYSSTVMAVTKLSDFVLGVIPTSKALSLGESTSFSVTGSSIGGFASNIELQVGSIPSGVTYTFDPGTIRPTSTTAATSTLKLQATPNAKTGVYSLVIVGKSGGLIHSSQVELTISALPSYILITVSPGSIKQTTNVTVGGFISPAVVGATVTLTYTKPDGTNITRSVKTTSTGNYSDSYNPMDPGTWKVLSSWPGDQSRTGAKSNQVQFQVTELSFIERYATTIGAAGLVVIIALVGVVFYLRRGKEPEPSPPVVEEEARPPTPPAAPAPAPPEREAPPAAPAPRPPAPRAAPPPTPPVREAPPRRPPAPAAPAAREAPPLVLPRKYCSNCGEVISAQAKFCDKCRAPQPETIEKKYEAPSLILPRKYCSNCGEVISAQAKFCDKCRAPQPD